MTRGRTRNGTIDVLRGISILLVLFHHFNIAYRLDDTSLTHVFGWEAVRAVARNGNYGVTMFFVISSYLITKNVLLRWRDPSSVDVRAFYGLRIARIYAEPARRILRKWLTQGGARAEIEYHERNRTDA